MTEAPESMPCVQCGAELPARPRALRERVCSLVCKEQNVALTPTADECRKCGHPASAEFVGYCHVHGHRAQDAAHNAALRTPGRAANPSVRTPAEPPATQENADPIEGADRG